MAKRKSKPLNGLIVNVPESTELGVVVEASKIRGNLYKATIISKTEVIIAKFKLNAPETKEPAEYIDWHAYRLEAIAKCL